MPEPERVQLLRTPRYVTATLLTAAAVSGASRLTAIVTTPVVTLSIEGRANTEPAIAALGRTVAVAWAASNDEGADVYAAVSRDGGGTFGAPVRVNDTPGTTRAGGEMAPRIALVPARGGAPPAIVVAWSDRGDQQAIRTARSVDGGRTFAPSRAHEGADAPGNRGWVSMALDAGGEPHLIWLDHRASASSAAAHHHHDVAEPTSEAPKPPAADAVARAQGSSLYHGGATAARELTKGVCYCCKTAVAVSGRRVVAAWRHVYAGSIRDIAFIASRDGGATFGTPFRIRRDGWRIDGCPEDGPALGIDASGVAHAVWPTLVAGPTPYKALFYAATQDDRTFTGYAQVTRAGRTAEHPDLVVTGDTVAIVWDERVDDQPGAFVSWKRGSGTFSPAMLISDAAAARYPVVAAAEGHLVAAWRSGPLDRSTVAVRRVDLPAP
ncbi:MAG: exo-alpha-sialidase [Acidimicrobiia bacterium]|nr:exo-alpha-sialidase [Acidimicrobiia bacterium]